MTEITSTQQFYDIINAFKNSFEKTLTNCFLMPEEISILISQKRIFIKSYPEWLILICKREDYYNFYYYTTENSSTSCVAEFLNSFGNDDIYIDIVSRFGKGDLVTPEKLVAQGCAEKYKTYQRMQLPVKSIDFDITPPALPADYKLSFDFSDYNALSKLWNETLDEKSTPLPQKEELKKLCKEKKIITICTAQNELAAVIIFSSTSKQVLLQHLAVSKEHRRKGLALYLLCKCFQKALEENLSILRLWVDCNNSSAIALYERLNFQTDGMLCDQLYMKGK